MPTSRDVDAPDERAPAERRDARRNREALLVAARELLTARSDVPMYEIARRAGVGQATLYRHFSDRGSLVAAVAGENLEAFLVEAAAVEPGPDALAAVLRMSAQVIASSGAVIEVVLQETEPVAEVPAAERVPVLAGLQERFADVFDRPVREARKAGVVPRDFTAEDALFALAMVKGAIDLAGNDLPRRTAAAARAMDVVLNGLLRPAHRS